VAKPSCPLLTPRRAAWLVLRREAKRTAAEAQQLAQLHVQSAEVAEAIDLAQDFATLVRRRQPMQLDPWLTRATTSMLEALRRFATGLYEDDEAVKAGVTLPWCTSPVEGPINRLKMLKRQMFGRASACEQERSQPEAVAASSRVSNRAWRDTTPDALGDVAG
jgi:transposase